MDPKPHELLMASEFSWKRLLTAELILATAMALILAVAVYIGRQQWGASGVMAAAIAFLVCWVPNALSLLVMGFIRDPQASVSAMLLSMLVRMAIPMIFIVFLMQSRHWLAGAGAMTMVVVFYLAALVIETPLSLWVLKSTRDSVVKVS